MKLPLVYRLVEPGANLHPLEILPVYACAFWFSLVGGTGDWGDDIVEFATANAVVQLVLFVVVVQIPSFVTGIMSNVDVAWPTGLVLLAVQALRYKNSSNNYNDNNYNDNDRAFLMSLALLLHGARMVLGVFYLYFPFDWPDGDLSRYRYAKKRWSEETAADGLWWLKQQHDTIMQAYANSVYIAAPIILVVTNPNPAPLRPLEAIGFGCWLVSWISESVSDVQMGYFVIATRRKGDGATAVVGHPPYDGWKFHMWTKCRHPNYFFEWMCWNSWMIMAVPSALDLVGVERVPLAAKVGIVVMFVYLSRFIYVCLLYWTGAEPAESRSVKRRPLYKEYQKGTNVLFPFSVPFFDHHRKPGWPLVGEAEQENLDSADATSSISSSSKTNNKPNNYRTVT